MSEIDVKDLLWRLRIGSSMERDACKVIEKQAAEIRKLRAALQVLRTAPNLADCTDMDDEAFERFVVGLQQAQ